MELLYQASGMAVQNLGDSLLKSKNFYGEKRYQAGGGKTPTMDGLPYGGKGGQKFHRRHELRLRERGSMGSA